MTAQQKTYENVNFSLAPAASMFGGDATEMYSSASLPSMAGDAIRGDATALFSSASKPCGDVSATGGALTGMFSSAS